MKTIKLILLALIASVIVGCDPASKNKITPIDDPEIIAVEFFNAIYNEKNLKKAVSVCSPKLSRIILHYKSPKAVARHLFNMSYDKVEVKPDDSGVKIRKQFENNATVTIYFDGVYNDDRLKDVKRLALKKIKGKWIIVKLLKDPF